MPLKAPVVILADGAFPTHRIPLEALTGAGTLICCDGAANHMIGRSTEPGVVIGDLDSISDEARSLYSDRLVERPSQQSGDLEKALQWAAEQGAGEVTVLGALGLRDDHGLANLLMLWYDFGLDITLLTDSGQLIAVHAACTFPSFEGQIVSLFPESARVRITTTGLAYPLSNTSLPAHHKGLSNRSLGQSFSIKVSGGAALVYQGYPPGG